MFHEVGVEDMTAESVVHLGKKSSDIGSSPRPMKVVVDSVENKIKLLRNAKITCGRNGREDGQKFLCIRI